MINMILNNYEIGETLSFSLLMTTTFLLWFIRLISFIFLGTFIIHISLIVKYGSACM